MAENGRGYKTGNRIFFGKSRSQKRASNNLGVIAGGNYGIEKKHYRCNILKTVDNYLYGEQYDGLADWNEKDALLRNKKPRIIFPFAKIYQDRISSKLVGHSTFPKFKLEDDEETEYFLNKVVIPQTYFKSKMLSLAKDFVLRTSAFCRFRLLNGSLVLEKYNSNHCYPEFSPSGDLESIQIRYIYDTDEFDPSTGRNIRRWFKLDLTANSDIEYSNPEYRENEEEPEFEVVSQVNHNLGFVQGEWFRYGENNHSADGEEDPVIYLMREWIDCLNYNLSLSDNATNYGTEPQLTIKGMSEDEAENLIKSVSKTWLLGREGDAQFIETANSGVQTAREQREDYLKQFQNITRLVLLDPEKMVGSAQSAKAMEVLHGPLVELINEFRPYFEKGMKALIQKIIVTIVVYNNAGFETSYITPPKWEPQSLDFTVMWPPIFELTTQDKQQILSMALQATGGNIISRDSALRWLQSQGVDFGIEDFDLEMQKVNTQQQFNTWGGF